MQTPILLTLLAAAVGINAAPGLSPRLTSIPVNIYDSAGCNNGRPATTAFIPTDGSCFSPSPILTQNTDSALIDPAAITIPAGCTLTLYSNSTCNSVNFITVTNARAGQCFTFGPGKFVAGAKTSGTC